MAIYNNTPTFTWVKLDGIVVIHDAKIYTIEDLKTNLEYIYWESDNPYKLKASNVDLGVSGTRFLVLRNNRGEGIIVPNDIIKISFDGTSREATEERIYGLYEKTDAHDVRFTSVETSIDGITQTVGKLSEDDTLIKEDISKIKQDSSSIDLSVQQINKTYVEDKLRDNVNKKIIEFNSNLGLFYSKILEYSNDSSISTVEKTEIQVQESLINTRKSELYIYVDNVIQMCVDNLQTTHVTSITQSKDGFETSVNNLITNINNVISDNVITTSDRTLIVNSFSDTNIKINTLKTSIDNAIVLGMGGSISESISNINMKSNEINLNVQENDKYAKSQLSILSGEISSKVNSGDMSSILRQSSTDIKFGFNGISDNVVINSSGLTVNQGSIACDLLTTPYGHEPVITLFSTCQLDARESDGSAGGSAIRLKYDVDNYLFINSNGMALYKGGLQILAFNGTSSSPNISSSAGTIGLRSDGLYYAGTKLSMNGHTHTGYASSSHDHSGDYLNPYNISPSTLGNGGTILMHDSLDGNGKNLGYSGSRFNQVNAINGYFDYATGSSDINKKENIKYITRTSSEVLKQNDVTLVANEMNFTSSDFYNFVKDELNLASYNYIRENNNIKETDYQLGFIANEVVLTDVGSKFVYYDEEGQSLTYSMSGYTTVIAGALQEEIKIRTEENKQLKSTLDLALQSITELQNEVKLLKESMVI